MSNINIIFPKENVFSPVNNVVVSQNVNTDTIYLQVGENIITLQTKKADYFIPGLEYADINDCTDLVRSRNIVDIILFVNKFAPKGIIDKGSGPFKFSYSKKELFGFVYSSELLEINIKISGDCLLILNNKLFYENAKVSIPKNIFLPIRMIFCNGTIEFGVNQNIFYLLKEKDE